MPKQTGISTKARGKLRAELSSNVTKAAKALRAAETKLTQVTTRAKGDVATAKAAFDSARQMHTAASGDFSKFEQVFGGGDAPTAAAKPALTKSGAPRKKPGPKPGGKKAKAVAKEATPRKKPGPKPGAKKAAVTAKSKAKSAKAPKASRKMRGDGMTMVQAMVHVMGAKTMSAGEIVAALKEKDLSPNSNKPQAYMSAVLSSASETEIGSDGKPVLDSNGDPYKIKVFILAKRGYYYVAKKKGEVVRIEKAAAEPKKAKGAGGAKGGSKRGPKATAAKATASATAAAPAAPAEAAAAAAPAAPTSASDEADDFLRGQGLDPAALGSDQPAAPLS